MNGQVDLTDNCFVKDVVESAKRTAKASVQKKRPCVEWNVDWFMQKIPRVKWFNNYKGSGNDFIMFQCFSTL